MKVKASKLGNTPSALVEVVRKAVELSCGAKFSNATLADRVRRRMEEKDQTPWNVVVAKDFLVNVRYAKCAAVLCTIDSAQLKVLVFKAARDDAPPTTPETSEEAPAKAIAEASEPEEDTAADDAGEQQVQRLKNRFRIVQSNIDDAAEEDAVIDCVENAMGASHDFTDILKAIKAKLTDKYPGTWQILMSTGSEIAASAPSVRMLSLRTKNTCIVVWQSTQNAFYEPSVLSPFLEQLSLRRLLFMLGSLMFMAHMYLRMTLNDCCLEPTEAKPLSEKCLEIADACTDEEKAAAENQQWWSRNMLLAMMVVFGLNLALKFTEKKQAAAKKQR